MKPSLRYYGDPIFRTKGASIEKIDEEIRALARSMIEIMDTHHAIGLAANQVGVALRLFVLRNSIPLPDGTSVLSATPLVFINPKILSTSREMQMDFEASPSFPGVQESIERPFAVTIEALDLNGKPFVDHSEGLNARVRFHEMEQLDGIVFIDHLPAKVRKRIETDLKNKV